MAHTCPKCGMLCHCGGDIDDIDFGETDDCVCSTTTPPDGCGNDIGYDVDSYDDYLEPKEATDE